MPLITTHATSGGLVYVRVYRVNTSDNRQVWNAGVGAWETYSDGKVNDYDTPADEEGTSGDYVADIPSGALATDQVVQIQFYWPTDQVSVDPMVAATGDTLLESFITIYDFDVLQFLPPVRAVSATDDFTVAVDTLGSETVYFASDLGTHPHGVLTEFVADSPLPDDVIFNPYASNSNNQYQFNPNDGSRLLRSSTLVDPTKPLIVEFEITTTGANACDVYIGFGSDAADINDVEDQLLEITGLSQDGTKELFKAAFYLSLVDNAGVVQTPIADGYQNDEGFIGDVYAPAGFFRITYIPGFAMYLDQLISGVWTNIKVILHANLIEFQNTEHTLAFQTAVRNLDEGGTFILTRGKFYGPGALVGNTFPINSQPRVNKPAGKAFRRDIGSRADGTHKINPPIRLRAGVVDSIAVSIDMQSLFGKEYVNSIGTPTVAASGHITVTAAGPRDTEAMVILGGTAIADATYTVTVPVVMNSGEQVDVDFDVEVIST